MPVPPPVGRRKGILIIALRLLAETKFLALYIMAYFFLIKEAQRVLIEAACDADRNTSSCPQPVDKAFCSEAEECAFDGTANQPFLGIDPSMQSKHSTFSFVVWFAIAVVLNVCVVLFMFQSVISAQRWRRSDLALCFQLNGFYATKYVRGLRQINFIGFGISVSSLFVSSAIKGALVPMLSSQVVAWSAAFTSLMSLHAAEDSLTAMSFATYRKHLIVGDEADDGDADDFAGFQLTDLLASAPQALMAKLSAAAVAEEIVEIKQAQASNSAGAAPTAVAVQQSL